MTENLRIVNDAQKNVNNLVTIKTICGPMYAGKSAKIIEIAGTFERDGINYVCLKPDLDHRRINGISTENRVVSRGVRLTVEAIELNIDFTEEVSKEIIDKYDAFVFDETQFFKLESIKSFIEIAKETGKKVQFIFAGLDMDFTGKEFGTIKYVKEISNEIVMLHASCSVKGCENKATHSSKIGGNKDQQVEVGGDDMYKPTCEEHFKKILDDASFEFKEKIDLSR